MSKRLNEKLAKLRKEGRKGLYIYITAGCPNAEETVDIVRRAEEAGADVIELGLPFSDPMADGPVIQEASVMALKQGMTLKKALDIVKEIRKHSEIPLIGMGYINMVHHYGFEKFVADFSAAGMDGVILPDVPHEESEEMRAVCAAHDFTLTEFITPGTTEERMAETCRDAAGDRLLRDRARLRGGAPLYGCAARDRIRHRHARRRGARRTAGGRRDCRQRSRKAHHRGRY